MVDEETDTRKGNTFIVRKIEPSFIADILTDDDSKLAIPKQRREFMRRFADGETTKEIAAYANKSPAHVYIEIARGIEDWRIYAEILNTSNYETKQHLLHLVNAAHYAHNLGYMKSTADIRRAIRNLIV